MPKTHSNRPADQDWTHWNQRQLLHAIGLVRQAVESHGAPGKTENSGLTAFPPPEPHCTLAQLSTLFGLTPFELAIVILCAAMELESSFAGLAHPPTFSLALAALPAAHWSALSPDRPLRRWRLIDIGSSSALTTASLRIDERVLHFLTGVDHLDAAFAGLVTIMEGAPPLAPSHRDLAARAARAWEASSNRLLLFAGPDVATKRMIATAAAEMLGFETLILPAQAVPQTAPDCERFTRLLERECLLRGAVVLLEGEPVSGGPAEGADNVREQHAVRQFTQFFAMPLGISSYAARRDPGRPMVTLDIRKPTLAEQRQIWREALGHLSKSEEAFLPRLTAQFHLMPSDIYSAAASARAATAEGAAGDLTARAWDACRMQVRARLEDLAQRLEPKAKWDDLVLPEKQKKLLAEVAIQVRERSTVYEQWGFGNPEDRGLGISAMFAGSSGTGKTMAAEVLASELRLDLYRIDLSSVVSKYIGETEKNLRRLFDAAEEAGAILLFDEADALFGHRSEVKDSHDRYANIEVSYLLQRLESYRGLAILTTNMRDAVDSAFLRRIRFIVDFPFPGPAQRAEIWRRAFPPQTPTDGLDFNLLGQLNVAGGNIRNIALHAAFLAADAREPIRPAHILRAAGVEYDKLSKSLSEAELRGFQESR